MLRELVRGLVAVPDAVAESADPEELEVVLRRVDLFSTRRAEFSTVASHIGNIFPSRRIRGKTPWEPLATLSYARSH